MCDDAIALLKVALNKGDHYSDAKLTTLKAKHVVPRCFEQRQGESIPHLAIGPCFNESAFKSDDEELRTLQESWPNLNGLSPPLFFCSSPTIMWNSVAKPINGWIAINPTEWFNRMADFHQKWINNRIHGLIRLAFYTNFPFESVTTNALLLSWHTSYNCFILPRGIQTVTLEDIALITGLSPDGAILPFDGPINNEAEKLYKEANVWFKHKGDPKGSKIAFNRVCKSFEDPKTTALEEVILLEFVFSRLLMNKGAAVNKSYLYLAANIAVTHGPIALGPFLLAQFYRMMFCLRNKPLHASRTAGPLWLLSCWTFLYYPELLTLKNLINDGIPAKFEQPMNKWVCYGEAAVNLITPLDKKEQLLVLCTIFNPQYTATWCPCFEMRLDTNLNHWCHTAFPKWMHETNPLLPTQQNTGYWRSVLSSRDLLYYGKEPGVEVYNPQVE